MIIEQIYTGCLSQGAYYIESNGEAAIIDPLREVDQYILKAKKNKASIKYIFETHFHADFVSGHLTLSKKTNAPIIYGPNANTSFESINAKDGQRFSLGEISIEVLHTPGHTMESSCFLLRDKKNTQIALFSGDTVFMGDVGRPDLAQKSDLSKEDLAGHLYESIHNKILKLDDDVIIYPAHGAGSACGKNMMKITYDSLKSQKKLNYALNSKLTKQEFIEKVLDGLQKPPQYFPENVKLNKEGYEDIDKILSSSKKLLNANKFEEIANENGALVLDVRSKEEYENSHIPRSIFIGLDGGFAPWVGELIIDVKTPILLVCNDSQIEEAVTRLSRVGFDNTLGYITIEKWKENGKEIDLINSISAIETVKRLENKSSILIDVRKENEYKSQHVVNAHNYQLSSINNYLPKFEEKNDYYIHCQSGYRSMIACSILKSRGIHNITNVIGGFKNLGLTTLNLSNKICPSKL
jgi:glyoxylase-like metal-dependent hydrolase (beta-lactamase superfamily II)/rhodanese-related sulfurtransferase